MEETDGVLRLGEIPLVARKDAPSAEDHVQAYNSGATDAYQSIIDWATQHSVKLPRYEDTGLLSELQAYAADRIREVNNGTL